MYGRFTGNTAEVCANESEKLPSKEAPPDWYTEITGLHMRLDALTKKIGEYGSTIRFSTLKIETMKAEHIKPIPEPTVMECLAALSKRLKELERNAGHEADIVRHIGNRVGALEAAKSP
jgi:tetrahydromethanopterin S-methyltransferase subunit G